MDLVQTDIPMMADSQHKSKCESTDQHTNVSLPNTLGSTRIYTEEITEQTPMLHINPQVEIDMPTKPNRRRNTWSTYSGISSQATSIEKNGIKSATEMKTYRRRNSWPRLTTIGRQETFHNGKKHKQQGRAKKYFNKKKQRIVSKKAKVKRQVSPYLRILPFILAITGLTLTSADLGTDMASSYRICTAECSCEYTNDMCVASKDICGDGMINGTSVRDYCSTNDTIICMNKEPWPVPQSILGFKVRHPLWCRLSIEFIIAPSILNNIVTLISLLYKSNYKRYFITAGLSSLANYPRSIVFSILSIMSMLQILPYMCMCLKIMTAWRIFRRYIPKEDEDSNDLMSLTRNICIIFTLIEDLPQMALQTMFLVRATVHDAEDGIVDDLSWVAVASLVISCVSLSKNYTLYVMNLRTTSTGAVTIFSTAFIAAGCRVLVCCLMAVGYHHSGYTKMILLPVSSAIAIQIALLLFKYRFSVSGKKSLSKIKEKFSRGQTASRNFLNATNLLGSGIRSILFGAIMDGYSPLGLWSSACYATWSMRTKVNFFTDEDQDTTSLSSTAIRWAMILYGINSILVFKNYPDRKNSILVSFLFIIYPVYLCAMAIARNKNMWYGLYIEEDLIFDKIITSLIPIITLVGLVMLVNIISFVLNKIKAQKPASDGQVSV